MNTVPKLAVPHSIVADVKQRIDQWRCTRSKRGPMPESLWQEAAQLARRLGLTRVSRALHLHYSSLKRAVERASHQDQTSRPAFVEVSVCSQTAISPGCLVEMERPNGARMTVRGASQSDLVALSETFFRCRA